MTWTAETVLTAISQHQSQTCVKEDDLVNITQLTAKQIEHACLKLREHGFIEKTDVGCHSITDAGREAIASGQTIRSGPKAYTAPKVNKNSLRIKVWRAMRIRQKFSIPELVMLIATGGEKDITSNVGKYLRALEKAGIIVRMAKRERGAKLTSNGYIRYWLTPERNTGPNAPVWRVKKDVVYDPNTEQEYKLCHG